MTLINRLISEAKAGAKTLTINDKDVSSIAEHFRMLAIQPVRKETCERMLRDGLVKIYGVPVSVQK
jgi:hypothetical protein